jgi:NAD(P)-dependent dehydrogenase (short-subunit alcohol dehydrogenase family)
VEKATVLTTGANSGIGLATVLELARRGYRSVGSVRSEAKADVVAKAAATAGVEVDTVLFDVTDSARCAEVVEELRPYGIVNNAGFSSTGAIEDVSDDEARRQLEAMVVAPMRLARLALPYMREAGRGRVVNVSSIYGRATTPFSGWYQASKHALEALTDAFRMEVARDGIKVVLVEPGGFKTGIWEENARDIARREGTRYGSAYHRTLVAIRLASTFAGNPAGVAGVIAGALSSGAPRARYLVGYDAQALAVMDSLTPTTIKDRVIRLALGL